MNALLQYKDKIEEQFLSSIDSTDFKEICQGNIEFFKHYLQANFINECERLLTMSK